MHRDHRRGVRTSTVFKSISASNAHITFWNGCFSLTGSHTSIGGASERSSFAPRRNTDPATPTHRRWRRARRPVVVGPCCRGEGAAPDEPRGCGPTDRHPACVVPVRTVAMGIVHTDQHDPQTQRTGRDRSPSIEAAPFRWTVQENAGQTANDRRVIAAIVRPQQIQQSHAFQGREGANVMRETVFGPWFGLRNTVQQSMRRSRLGVSRIPVA